MAVCDGCGSTVAESAAFCLNCGKAMSESVGRTMMWRGVGGEPVSSPVPVPGFSSPTTNERRIPVADFPVAPAMEPAMPAPYVAPLAPAEQLSERTAAQLQAVAPIVVPRPDRVLDRAMAPVAPASISSLEVELKTMVKREPPRWESQTFFQRLVLGRRRPTRIASVAWTGFFLGLILLAASVVPVGGRFIWERLSPLSANVFLLDLVPAVLALFHLATPALTLSVRERAFTQLATAALILVPRAILEPPLFAPNHSVVQLVVSLYIPPVLAAVLWWRSRSFEDILPRVACSIVCVLVLALILLPFDEGRPSLASAAIEALRRAQGPDLRAFALPTTIYGLSAGLGITATLMRSKGIAGIWAFVVAATFSVWLALMAHAAASGAASGSQLEVVAAFTAHGAASLFAILGLVFVLAPKAHDG